MGLGHISVDVVLEHGRGLCFARKHDALVLGPVVFVILVELRSVARIERAPSSFLYWVLWV